MTQEEQESIRKDRAEKIISSWMRLSQNPDFKLVYEQDLQPHFGMFHPSFRSGDGFNPHAAATRDGNKAVLLYIFRRLNVGLAMLDADDTEPEAPKEAISEFKGA